MFVGVPKEIKNEEFRVSLLPLNVMTLIQEGHTVYVQKGAGEGSGFSDSEYEEAGATVLKDARSVYKSSEMIVKVKEPQESEYELLQEKQILFTYLHLAPLRELTQLLIDKNIIAIAYETIEVDGTLPLLRPMSEIAGEMAPIMGAFYLSRQYGSKGALICGASSVKPLRVLILGNGIVAMASAKIAKGLGADVHIIARHPKPDTEILLNDKNLEDEISEADIIIGAILVKGAKAPYIITKNMLHRIQKGSLIIDVSIDQGGCIETSHPTTHDDPVFDVEGIIHYCVANMPGAYPQTASIALSNTSIEYVQLLANRGYKEAVQSSKALSLGVNICLGKVTYRAVADAHGLEYTSIDKIL